MDRPIPFAGLAHPDPMTPSPWVLLGIADDTQSTFLRGPAEAPVRVRESYDGRCFNATTETGVDLQNALSDRGDLKPLHAWHASAEMYTSTIDVCMCGGSTSTMRCRT